MNATTIVSLVWTAGLLVIVAMVLISRRTRRHGGAYTAGVVGAMYEWQNRDKQKAISIVVDGKAAQRDAESPDEPPVPTGAGEKQ
jgi:hypothetical protein